MDEGPPGDDAEAFVAPPSQGFAVAQVATAIARLEAAGVISSTEEALDAIAGAEPPTPPAAEPDSKYPDVPEDADGFDAVTRVIAGIDRTAIEKSAALSAMAYTEYRYAKAAGDIPEELDFPEWAETAAQGVQDATEAMNDG